MSGLDVVPKVGPARVDSPADVALVFEGPRLQGGGFLGWPAQVWKAKKKKKEKKKKNGGKN